MVIISHTDSIYFRESPQSFPNLQEEYNEIFIVIIMEWIQNISFILNFITNNYVHCNFANTHCNKYLYSINVDLLLFF